MKLILSRKGFDSSNGKCPSPILPDGTLLSLPIPSDKSDADTYSALQWNGKTFDKIIYSLHPKTSLQANSFCHLDPDIRADVKKRSMEWQPAFGQRSSSLSVLRNNGVGIGDLFLFFGWFKETEYAPNGELRYKRNAPDLHIIYGYMQIGSIIEKKENVPVWLTNHPHVSYNDSWAKNINALFIPSQALSLLPNIKGCDVLNFREDRVLTKRGYSRGKWDLPSFFRDVKITYHPSHGKITIFSQLAKDKSLLWMQPLRLKNGQEVLLCKYL